MSKIIQAFIYSTLSGALTCYMVVTLGWLGLISVPTILLSGVLTYIAADIHKIAGELDVLDQWGQSLDRILKH